MELPKQNVQLIILLFLAPGNTFIPVVHLDPERIYVNNFHSILEREHYSGSTVFQRKHTYLISRLLWVDEVMS
jgi:hypothetical protein